MNACLFTAVLPFYLFPREGRELGDQFNLQCNFCCILTTNEMPSFTKKKYILWCTRIHASPSEKMLKLLLIDGHV